MIRVSQVVGIFATALLVGLVVVGGASATLWLKNGASLLKADPASWHGEFILHHAGGLAGSYLILCSYLLDGTVGPGAKDEVTDILSLSGALISSTNKLTCLVHTGTTFCPAGTLVLKVLNGLPWLTELVLIGSETVDEVKGSTEMGSTVECKGISVTCNKNESFKFDENLANGALFLALGRNEISCSDGGKGSILGMFEVLGFTVS